MTHLCMRNGEELDASGHLQLLRQTHAVPADRGHVDA